MRVRKPNTDQEAECYVFINDQAVTEYCLIPPMGPDFCADIVECFIPVEEGDEITVKGKFSGSVLNGSIDLVVDGSFLAGSCMEGPELRLSSNRKFEFKKALSCNFPPGWKSIESPKEIEEGYLLAKVLPREYGDLTRFELASPECTKPGLGSIQVIISINQQPTERYRDKHSDITVGHWRTRDVTLVRKSGILPDHELELKVEDANITQTRSKRHRRHWDGDRAGTKPWAKFVFYYRLSSAIRAAGCIECPNDVQDLEPGDASIFVRAERKKNKTKQAGEQVYQGDDYEGYIAIENLIPANMFNSRTPESQPNPPTEQRSTPRRLGGTLNLAPNAAPSSITGDANKSSDSTGLIPGPPVRRIVGNGSTSSRRRGDTFGLAEYRGNNFSARVNSGVTGLGNGETVPSHAATNARDRSTSRAAAIRPGPPHSQNFGTSSQANFNYNDLATPNAGNMVDTFTLRESLAADLLKVPTIEAIRNAINPDGIDDFAMNMLYMDGGNYAHDLETNLEFEQRRDSVAIQDEADGQWYTRERYAEKQAEKAAEEAKVPSAAGLRRDSGLHKTQEGPAPPLVNEELTNWFANLDQDSLNLGPELDMGLDMEQEPGVQPAAEAQPEPVPAQAPATEADLIQIKQEDFGTEMEVDAEVPPYSPTPAPTMPSTPLPKEQPQSASRTQPQPQPPSSTKRPRSSPPGTQSPAAKRSKSITSDLKVKLQQSLAAKKIEKEELARQIRLKSEAKAATKAAKKAEKRKLAEEKRRHEEEEVAELERLQAEEEAEIARMKMELADDGEEDDSKDEESEEE